MKGAYNHVCCMSVCGGHVCRCVGVSLCMHVRMISRVRSGWWSRYDSEKYICSCRCDCVRLCSYKGIIHIMGVG